MSRMLLMVPCDVYMFVSVCLYLYFINVFGLVKPWGFGATNRIHGHGSLLLLSGGGAKDGMAFIFSLWSLTVSPVSV